MQSSQADAFAGASAVFEGQVLTVRVGERELAADVEVVRAWKGMESERLQLKTSGDSASCGYPLKEGVSYLFYASAMPDGALSVSLCSRTMPMSEASDDLRVLGMGATPVDPKLEEKPAEEPKEKPATRTGCQSCSVGHARDSHGGSVVLSLLAAAALSARFIRRRRRFGSRS